MSCIGLHGTLAYSEKKHENENHFCTSMLHLNIVLTYHCNKDVICAAKYVCFIFKNSNTCFMFVYIGRKLDCIQGIDRLIEH